MNHIQWAIVSLVGTLLASGSASAMTRITKVEYLGRSEPGQIIVSGDGPLEFEKIDNTADKQIILEFKNAKLANANAGRKLDASSFKGKVTLISPYNVDGQNAVRVIVQLRDNASTEAIAQGNKLFMAIDGSPDPTLMSVATASEAPSSDLSSSASAPVSSTTDGSSASSAVNVDQTIPLAPTAEKRLEQLSDATERKIYVGRKITLQFKEADVVDVFKLIGEASGFNVVLGPEVTGKISLTLVDVPWDLALDTVLSTLKLGAERKGNVLRVSTLAALTQEKQQLNLAKDAAAASAPRITRIFPISYATPTALITILSRFGGGAAGSGSASANRDTIIVDERTNSLVIQDTADNIERMGKIIELLDKPTPQVQIEAKIVEAQEGFTKTMGGNLGFGAREPRGSSGAYAGGSIQSGGLTDPAGGDLLSTIPNADGISDNFGFGFKIGALSNLRLNALLSISETESKSKTISSPRTVVLNKQQATILQGTPVLVPTTTIVSGVPTASETTQSANLSLNVTPTVTNDGNIIMDLTIQSDTPQALSASQSGIANRNMRTRVVSESGSTLVIGGVYTERSGESQGGIPFLRKIPLIGALFGSEGKNNLKTELFIFITPRVLNEKESGGAG